MHKKLPFLLVHGGMHGAWCWKRVRQLLSAAGHDVVSPTLTGLGCRSHLGGGPAVDLRTHIADVLSCAESEELEDFALVGHSYGGMVITGVADQIGAHIASLIYLDALVPDHGQAACDLISRGLDYSSLPGGMLPAIPGYNFGLTDPADIAWVHRRITPQSVRTVTQSIEIRSDLSRLHRSFIECVDHREGQPMMMAIATRAHQIARDPSWSHHVLLAGHDCMISHPAETSALLLNIVGARKGGAGRRA